MFENEWWLAPPCDEFLQEEDNDGEDAYQNLLDQEERSFDEYLTEI